MLEKIKSKLKSQLQPTYLELIDDSRKHAGHPEAIQRGGEHFQLLIVAPVFENLKPVERHRLIYQALQEEIREGIHALAIQAYTPTEFKNKK